MSPRDSGDAAGIAPGGAEPADAAAAASPYPKISPFSIYYSLVINNPRRGLPRQDPPFPGGARLGQPGPPPFVRAGAAAHPAAPSRPHPGPAGDPGDPDPEAALGSLTSPRTPPAAPGPNQN